MASSALIDTGAIVALRDPTDPWHHACSSALRQLRFPLVTSEAVLTESFHLLDDHRAARESTWAFIRSGALLCATINHDELAHIHALMSRYWDHPMDFADATLVYLARRESISTVFTVDHGDFETYRIEGTRRFHIVPGKKR